MTSLGRLETKGTQPAAPSPTTAGSSQGTLRLQSPFVIFLLALALDWRGSCGRQPLALSVTIWGPHLALLHFFTLQPQGRLSQYARALIAQKALGMMASLLLFSALFPQR